METTQQIGARPRRRDFILFAVLGAALAGCQAAPPPAPPPPPSPPRFTQIGLASWYGPHFSGKRTADGERLNANALTAAHRTLPINTMVRVTDLENGRSVVVRINDRGPYHRGRIIDVSAEAARMLGMQGDGVARVRIEALDLKGAAF
ncbi:MAG TPA: septal ring lytic transglycosylase RlpA family protein [Stellaceae bacterium]